MPLGTLSSKPQGRGQHQAGCCATHTQTQQTGPLTADRDRLEENYLEMDSLASSPLAQCHRWVQSVSFPSHPALPLYAIPCLITMCEDGLIPKHSVTPLRLCWDSGPWSHRRGR